MYCNEFVGDGREHQDICIDVEKDPHIQTWRGMSSLQIGNEFCAMWVVGRSVAQLIYKYILHLRQHNQHRGKVIVWDKRMEIEMSEHPVTGQRMLRDAQVYDAQPQRINNLKTKNQL